MCSTAKSALARQVTAIKEMRRINIVFERVMYPTLYTYLHMLFCSKKPNHVNLQNPPSNRNSFLLVK